MTPVTDATLQSEGDIKIEGRLIGSKTKATALVHVVSDPSEVPSSIVAPDPLEIREGSKLADLIKQLPTQVSVKMKNGRCV